MGFQKEAPRAGAFKRFDVLSIGILLADIPLRLPLEVVDFTQDTITIPNIDILPGGDAANTAIVLSQLGQKSALCAKTGRDSVGQAVKTALKERGVSLDYVLTDGRMQTGVSVVLINPAGDRTFVCAGGGESGFLNNLSLDDIGGALWEQTRHIHFGSLFAFPGLEKAGLAAFFRTARENGVTVSADVTYDSYHAGFESLRACLTHVDFLMPSYQEGKYLTGESDPEKMADFFIRETGEKTVIIKLGAEGCFLRSGRQCMQIPAFSVDAVDTTGAGDTFAGAFLAGIRNGWPLARCADFANAAAAFSVGYVGATTSEMSLARVTAFMEATPRSRST